VRIFDEGERTDRSPAGDTESSYHFLNRVARRPWALTRDLIEEWFAEYPVDAQADLGGRLRKDDWVQHMGAWWELYTHRLFRQLGYEVDIHPSLENTSRKPDFLVTDGETSMYVECVVFLSGLRPVKGQGDGERSWIFEATNRARDPNFFVEIEIRQSGKQRPKASEIVEPLENWLSALDPDEVGDQIAAGMSNPELVLTARGWVIEYSAWPRDPESRNEQGRLIGIYPVIGGWTNNEVSRYYGTVKGKGGRYGTPDKPFVVAVLNTSPFLEQDEVAEALLGTDAFAYYPEEPQFVKTVRRRDGYWRQGPPERGVRVSAVLDGNNIYPWQVSARLPKLWINPWATHPVNAALPFDTLTAHDTGEVYQKESETSANAVFGLNPDWPGFGCV
jgi:hypothetical protein